MCQLMSFEWFVDTEGLMLLLILQVDDVGSFGDNIAAVVVAGYNNELMAYNWNR